MTLPALFATLLASAPQDTTRADTVVQLSELVITATREPARARYEQAPALSIARPSPSARGNTTVAADLVRDLPGAQVQQTSAGQGAVILRGLTGNQVLLLVDGIPLNNGTHRDGPGQYLATVDPGSIEQIEVIRGPASVLYGSDAQGGVLNLVTRPHPAGTGVGLGAALHGSTASGSYRARASGRWASTRLSAAAGASFARASDLRPGGTLDTQLPTSFHAVGADLRVDFQAGKAHRVSAAAQLFEMSNVHRYDRYVTFRAPEPGPDVEHRFDPQTRQLVYLRYRHDAHVVWLHRLEATASVSVQREGRFERARLDTGEPDSLAQHVQDDVVTPGFSLIGSSLPAVGSRTLLLTWGVEAYHDGLSSEGYVEHVPSGARTPLTRATADGGEIPSGRFPDGSSSRRIGAFVSGETDLAPWIGASVGARWSEFRSEAEVGTAFGGHVVSHSVDVTGQVGLVVRPSKPWRIAMRLAEGFRAPNLYDLTNVGSVPGGIQVPNPDAMPERSVSGEVSVRFQSEGIGAAVTGYRNWIRDFLDRAPGEYLGDTLFNGQRVYQGVNVGRATVSGAEVEVAFRRDRLDGGATMLYAYGEQLAADGEVQPMSKIPPLGGSARLRWTTRAEAWVEYGIRWAGAQHRLGERDVRDTRIAPGGTAGFFLHGLRAGVRIEPDIAVSVGLENLSDTLYREHASGIDAPGRHFWLELSWIADL